MVENTKPVLGAGVCLSGYDHLDEPELQSKLTRVVRKIQEMRNQVGPVDPSVWEKTILKKYQIERLQWERAGNLNGVMPTQLSSEPPIRPLYRGMSDEVLAQQLLELDRELADFRTRKERLEKVKTPKVEQQLSAIRQKAPKERQAIEEKLKAADVANPDIERLRSEALDGLPEGWKTLPDFGSLGIRLATAREKIQGIEEKLIEKVGIWLMDSEDQEIPPEIDRLFVKWVAKKNKQAECEEELVVTALRINSKLKEYRTARRACSQARKSADADVNILQRDRQWYNAVTLALDWLERLSQIDLAQLSAEIVQLELHRQEAQAEIQQRQARVSRSSKPASPTSAASIQNAQGAASETASRGDWRRPLAAVIFTIVGVAGLRLVRRRPFPHIEEFVCSAAKSISASWSLS